MKKHLLLIILLLAFHNLYSQFYLRGEVRDEKNNLLSGVRIKLFSQKGARFYTGDKGSFGIPSPFAIDTIKLSLDGFETILLAVSTQAYQVFTIKMLPATEKMMKSRPSSVTKNLSRQMQNNFFSSWGESYSSLIENGYINANDYPETGFSLNINRASYSNIRRFINNGVYVPGDAVRIEEMLNYFNFRLPQSNNCTKDTFSYNSTITTCPWNSDNKLLFINLHAPKLNLDHVPPSNLVFLIDVSGSMDKPNRLPLLQTAFKLLTENLRDIDTISIVTYGGNVGIALAPTSGSDKIKINRVIDSLSADGDTPGEEAIKTAYAVAKRAFIKNGNNRVILATDGDFNVGQVSEKQLEEMITFQRQSGIYLTCLGVGMGNYKDSRLETLAKKGNGNFAYLDNAAEAEKVMVTEFTKTMYAVASDAYLNINFNADVVKKYRLIGFDNKRDVTSDSINELEGGEIGSGHNMMVLFEIEQQQKEISCNNSTIARLSLKYKQTGNDSIAEQNFAIPYTLKDFSATDSSYRFATSVAMFGSLLKSSPYAKNYSYNDVLKIASSSASTTDVAQQEFITLIQKAEKIYNPKKKKKKE
jgi:Ca-activated chloride channel family protein